MLTRRKFFISSAVVVTSLGIDSLVRASPLPTTPNSPQERKFLENDQNYKNFLAYQGEVFIVSSFDDQNLSEEVELVEVVDTWGTDQLDQFWLRFKALPTSALEKGVYHFEHAQAGTIRLWIEPAWSNENGRYFEAHFTLLKNFLLSQSQNEAVSPLREDIS